MKNQPLLVILACFVVAVVLIVGSAIALKATDTPLTLVAGVASALGAAFVALTGRTQVFAPATTEALVTKALDSIPPADSKKAAADMIAAAKEAK